MEIMTAVTATVTILVILLAISGLYLDWRRFRAASEERDAAELASLLVGANVWLTRHTVSAAVGVVIVAIIKLDEALAEYHLLAVAVAVYAASSFMIAIIESLFAQRVEATLKVCCLAKKPFHRSV